MSEVTPFGDPATFLEHELGSIPQKTLSSSVGSQWVISAPKSCTNSTLRIISKNGATEVDELWIHVEKSDGASSSQEIHIAGAALDQFINVLRGPAFARVDKTAISALVDLPKSAHDGDQGELARIETEYRNNPGAFRALIREDLNASDLVALASRRRAVGIFETLLTDEGEFDAEKERTGRSNEGVWQNFFEENKWILGIGLSVQLLLSWDEDKLEQVVSGFDISGSGKRTDALLGSGGAVSLLAFAEIKHHTTKLLGTEYRSGCWSPSGEVTGAVSQSHGTVQMALETLGTSVALSDESGFEIPGAVSHLYRPSSFVVAGQLAEFAPEGRGVNKGMLRSFELYRRNLSSPMILTYDELLARAKFMVSSGER